jgi:hypothetical protein
MMGDNTVPGRQIETGYQVVRQLYFLFLIVALLSGNQDSAFSDDCRTCERIYLKCQRPARETFIQCKNANKGECAKCATECSGRRDAQLCTRKCVAWCSLLFSNCDNEYRELTRKCVAEKEFCKDFCTHPSQLR